MVKVSIVLPTYNGETYLSQSLDSIIHQTFTDWELIIVDDGSTDSVPDIIAEYVTRDSRIRSVRNDPNMRVARSLNRGFELAEGDYFTWTSDDNRFKPDALATLVETLETRSDVDLVYADYDSIDEQGNYLNTKIKKEPDAVFTSCVVGACFLYRRAVHERLGGYNPDIHLADDYEFWVRAYVEGFRLYHIRGSYYEYRTHSANLSSGSGNIDQALAISAQLVCDYLPRVTWFSRTRKAFIYMKRFTKGKWNPAKPELFKRAMLCNPLVLLPYLHKVLIKSLGYFR